MSDIEVPVRLANGSLVPARASAFVSLDDPDAKGIHMSRLFLALQTKLEEELSVSLMEAIIECFVDSHKGLSNRARVELYPLTSHSSVQLLFQTTSDGAAIPPP